MKQSAAGEGVVRDALLTYWQDGQEEHLSVGTTQWYSWLETATVFRFGDEGGTFTARKARSGNGRGGWYWRAYRRSQGRLLRCYLGKSENLSLERLRAAARQLFGTRQAALPGEALSYNPAQAMEEDALVLTKLFIPRLSIQHIPRPHLLALLDRAVRTSMLILVSAPAGSGKTTLLTEWSVAITEAQSAAKQRADLAVSSARRAGSEPDQQGLASVFERSPVARVAWLALESADNDIVRLLTYLIAALARLDSRIGQQARVLLRAVRGSHVERVLTSLVNDLATYLTQDAVLILDDYHLMTVPAIHQAFLFLLDHLPPRLHLVLGTRADPPLPLARLRARSQLSEVRGEDLRFAPAEASAFLREMGLELNADELHSLEQRAEGWIAGIQLLALALRGRAHSAELLSTFASSHRFLIDYLSDEVLQRQPAELRAFLLRSSVLERLCGSLCDALTGRSDGQVMLTELRRTNLFLTALDDSEQWYRYHPLFAAALRELLQRQEPGLAVELYRRAGAWYEQQDLPFQAIEYALYAGDHAHAADLMEPLARAMVWRGDLTALQHWVERLPDSVLFAHPHLCLAGAWVCLFGGLEVRMQELMDRIEHYLHEHEDESATPEWRELCGEFHIFEAVVALPPNHTDRAIERSQAALAVLPSEAHHQRNLASICIAVAISAAHRTSGDIAAAEEALVHVNMKQQGNYHFLSLIAMHDLAELYQAQGHLHKLAQHYEHLFSPLSIIHEFPTLLIFFVCADYAGLMYEWNRLNEAAMYIDRILQAYEQEKQRDGMLGLLLQPRAKISLAQGRTSEALQQLHELDVMIDTGMISQPMEEDAQAQRASLWLTTGKLEEARYWAREFRLKLDNQVDGRMDQEQFFRHMTLVRVLIAQARSERSSDSLPEALKLLDTWRTFSEQRGFNRLLIETLMLKALALEVSGSLQRALRALDGALALAEPEGYIRLFVDEGEPIERLLARLASRPHQATSRYIQALLTIIRGDEAPAPGDTLAAIPGSTPARHSPLLVEPLTPREQEVLALLASGASNQELAEALIITPNTAKRHVKHILSKLGVSNRVQAIARAREFNLL
jgi:LuxR family maltose regulon positive regulatory protein